MLFDDGCSYIFSTYSSAFLTFLIWAHELLSSVTLNRVFESKEHNKRILN